MINWQQNFVSPNLGTRDFFSRVTRSFVGRRPTCLRPLAEDTSDFLRLDRNRKPRMKRLWHPRYVSPNSASVIIPVINKSATPRTILDRTGLHSVMLSFLRLSNQIVESSVRRRGNLTSLVTSAKQSPYPCSEPPTNYRKYVLNFLSFWQIDNGFFLTIKHVHSTTSIYTKYTTYIIIITTRKNI